MSVHLIDPPTLAEASLPRPGTPHPRAGTVPGVNGPTRGAGKTTRRGRVYGGATRAPRPARAGAGGPNLGPDCPVVRAGRTYVGRQGHDFVAGISAETVGAGRLCLHLVTIPPGGRGRAHLHAGHETALYVLSGAAVTRFGPSLRRRVTVRAGDFHYIPAGVPHLPLNASADEPCVAVLARTDPNEQESVVLLPELEEAPLADG
ncbi:MAG: hypothetical protein AVDCRST_MAG19-141 [uncultured Thermomicrobiales bacterium]|uniref:Cupin type-2 domain-containing protein n=1 Tax=uncultured Thermomicrobiales bacterium TaxID=1645740 RepID=A0A6J4U8Q4_9BACT|nr:MAG: hypothetical protein AVDCRST_MAG19-141 [uncultured Thermomicrobiales bacterium]